MTDPSHSPREPVLASLERFREAMARGEERQAALLAEYLREGEHLSPRARRRLRRRLRRHGLDVGRGLHGPVAWLPGYASGCAAIAFAAIATMNWQTHAFVGWLAAAMGVMSANFIRLAWIGRREEAAARQHSQRQVEGRSEPADPRTAKVDALCDALLAELRGGPRTLQEVVRNPEAVVNGVRNACHDLVRRELALRSAVNAEADARLTAEREELSARIASAKDEVVRQRLGAALAALDLQMKQRAELATAAARLDAEHTRLYYTLEALQAQVLRARAADAGAAEVAGIGLKDSLARLGDEIDAVAASLESVSGAGQRPEPIAPISSDDDDARPPGGVRGRERS